MPLPNPAYLIAEYYNWNGYNTNAVRLTTSAVVTASKRNIRWEALDSFDRRTVHNLIMGYNDRLTVPEAEADAVANFVAGSAFQTIDFTGLVVGGNATGLVSGTDYNFSVVLNGSETFYTIAGADGDTFTNLVTALNTALPGTMLVEIFNGNLEVSTVATGSGQIIELFDESLFRALTGFKGLLENRVGVTTIEDVFDLNFRNGYQSYTELLIGKLRIVTNKAPRTAKTINDIYFNHGSLAWLSTETDT